MARTLDPDKRTRILDAAMRLFAARGVQNTSTSAIAREAGIAAGTLFLYFPTKQDLIHELVLEISREQAAHITALLAPELPVREAFATIWRGSLAWLLDNMEAFACVQQLRDPALLDPAVIEASAAHLGYYYVAIERGLAAGCIKPYPAHLIGAFLYQDIVAMMGLLAGEPDPARRQALIEQGFELFWDGIKTAGECGA